MTETLRAHWSSLSNEHRGNLVEWVTEQAILEMCTPGGTAIDIGANYGAHTHTMLVRVGPGGRVIAFEANPEITAHLDAWKAVHPSLTIVQRALSDREGSAEFFVCDNAGFSSLDEREILRHGQTASKKINVALDTLDHCVLSSIDSVQLIKIDVEGAELAVLRGAEGVLEKFRPVVIVEMSASELSRLEPEAYAIFVERTLGQRYVLMSVLGEVVQEPVAGDYQFFLVAKDDPGLIARMSQLTKAAVGRFIDEGLHDWTPYQKFQGS